MGFLTTATFHNDALGALQKDPKQFAKRIFEAMNEANRQYKAADASFVTENSSYGGYIQCEPSRHADDHAVFVHMGNTVFNINPWNQDFIELVKRSPDTAESFVKVAAQMVKECKEKIKAQKTIQSHKTS
jgi:hypothetical protein